MYEPAICVAAMSSPVSANGGRGLHQESHNCLTQKLTVVTDS